VDSQPGEHGLRGSIINNQTNLNGASVAGKILNEVDSNNSRLKSWPAYLFAGAVTAATLGLRLALADQLKNRPTLIVFTLPIMLSAYVGGLRAGLLATGLAYFSASYYLLPPFHSFRVASVVDRWDLFFVILAGVVISVLNEALHLARHRADQAIRERAEEARRTSEARYRTLFECAPDGIVIADPRGIYLDANGSICQMLGYAREELIGLPSSRIVAEAEAQHIQPALDAINTKSPYHREWQFRRKDGSAFDGAVIATQMPDGNVLAMIRDVTAHKQSEAALRDSEQKLRKVIDGLGPNTFIGLMSTEGILIEANRPALAAAGLSLAEVLGKPFDQTYWWGYSEPVQEQLRTAMARAALGEPTRYNVQLRVAGGSLVWADFSLNPVRDASGRVTYIVPSANIIDERVLAEEALLQAGALQRAIFNSANFSSIATDAKGVIQIFNVGAERMLGYTAAEVMNQITPADISDPQEVIVRAEALSVELGTPITPGFEALVFKASRGIEDIYELTYIRKDGKHRHRRKGSDSNFQRRGRADAGLHRHRGDEQNDAGGLSRAAGSDHPRQSVERRIRHPDCAGVRSPGLQGLARDRGHLRADQSPQRRKPVSRSDLSDGAARRPGRHHRLSVDRHGQHRAPTGRRRAEEARPALARPAVLHAFAYRIQH